MFTEHVSYLKKKINKNKVKCLSGFSFTFKNLRSQEPNN